MILQAIALGDAYGAGFEFAPEPFVVTNNNPEKGYVQNPTHTSLQPGCYTDDTQSSIAMAAVMLKDMWTPMGVAKALLAAYKQDERPGYASRYKALLDSCQDAGDFLERIRPNSYRAGAAMRSIPVGLTRDVSVLLHRSILHASITHATMKGITSAQAAALMFHLLYYSKVDSPWTLISGLNSEIPGWDWGQSPVAASSIPNEGVPCVRAAIHVLSLSKTMTEVLYHAVSLTGDVDTVAALAVPCAMYAPWITDKTFPPRLVDELEVSEFGVPYLAALDRRLIATFKRDAS